MPKGMQRKKSGGMRKHGRNEEKCKKYKLAKIREKNKLKRVLKSNGYKAAVKYAKLHGLKFS